MFRKQLFTFILLVAAILPAGCASSPEKVFEDYRTSLIAGKYKKSLTFLLPSSAADKFAVEGLQSNTDFEGYMERLMSEPLYKKQLESSRVVSSHIDADKAILKIEFTGRGGSRDTVGIELIKYKGNWKIVL